MTTIRRNQGEITLEEWLAAIVKLDGIRMVMRGGQHPPDGDAEVFDSRFAEWVPAFSWREGVVVLRNDSAPVVRAAEAAARTLEAVVTSD
jgi:hypothetical protein